VNLEFLAHIVFLEALQRLELRAETSANCSENILTIEVSLVNLTVDGNSGVDCDSIDLCKQLVLIQQHVVSLIIAWLFE
jgi:hypothetical protein